MRFYLPELAITAAFTFASVYPTSIGASVFCATLGAVLSAKALEIWSRKKAPALEKLEAEMKDVRNKLEHLMLKVQR